jgi:midasin (ATPase involved in ribosome maturation)
MSEVHSGDPQFYLGLSAHRLLCARLKTRKKKSKIAELIGRVGVSLPPALVEFLGESAKLETPFVRQKENDFDGICSVLTGLHVPTRHSAVPTLAVAFVRQFLEMIDIVQMGISLHYPVIIQGGSGQGKRTAVQFVAESLGFQVMCVALSSVTSIEDLFCKIVPQRREGQLEFVLQRSRLLMEIDA